MKISDLSNVSCVLWGKSVDGILGDLGFRINLMFRKDFSTRFDAEDMRMSQKMI
jgi:hypothetical protein